MKLLQHLRKQDIPSISLPSRFELDDDLLAFVRGGNAVDESGFPIELEIGLFKQKAQALLLSPTLSASDKQALQAALGALSAFENTESANLGNLESIVHMLELKYHT